MVCISGWTGVRGYVRVSTRTFFAPAACTRRPASSAVTQPRPSRPGMREARRLRIKRAHPQSYVYVRQVKKKSKILKKPVRGKRQFKVAFKERQSTRCAFRLSRPAVDGQREPASASRCDMLCASATSHHRECASGVSVAQPVPADSNEQHPVWLHTARRTPAEHAHPRRT